MRYFLVYAPVILFSVKKDIKSTQRFPTPDALHDFFCSINGWVIAFATAFSTFSELISYLRKSENQTRDTGNEPRKICNPLSGLPFLLFLYHTNITTHIYGDERARKNNYDLCYKNECQNWRNKINKTKKTPEFPAKRLEEMQAAFETFKKEALQREQAMKKESSQPEWIFGLAAPAKQYYCGTGWTFSSKSFLIKWFFLPGCGCCSWFRPIPFDFGLSIPQ